MASVTTSSLNTCLQRWLINKMYPCPFFLEHIILKPEWMMNDGLHPKSEAQPWIAEFVAEELYQYL